MVLAGRYCEGDSVRNVKVSRIRDTDGRDEKFTQVFSGKPETPNRYVNDNIKQDLTEIG